MQDEGDRLDLADCRPSLQRPGVTGTGNRIERKGSRRARRIPFQASKRARPVAYFSGCRVTNRDDDQTGTNYARDFSRPHPRTLDRATKLSHPPGMAATRVRFEHDHLEVLRLLFMSSRTYCGPDRYGYDSHSHSDTTKSEFGDPNELQDLPARSGSTGKMNRLSIKIIRRFSSLNRSLCAALESRFPRVFDTMGEGTTYVPLISTTAKRMIRDGARDVIEVGGIDRPLLHRDGTFRYVGLDIEYRERCREVYDHFLVQSIESPIEGRFDLIFSQHLLEHVRDNRAAARSMFAATKPAGFVCHYVPNRGHPYALLLRMLSNRLQRRLLELTSPTGKTKGGYPTYFDRCNPSEMRQTFIEAGFTNVSTVVFYSPTPYFRVFLPAHVLIVAFMHVCRWMGLDAFCSGFVITAERPGATTTEPDPESIDSRNVHHQPDAC